jgi:hypothetical protein
MKDFERKQNGNDSVFEDYERYGTVNGRLLFRDLSPVLGLRIGFEIARLLLVLQNGTEYCPVESLHASKSILTSRRPGCRSAGFHTFRHFRESILQMSEAVPCSLTIGWAKRTEKCPSATTQAEHTIYFKRIEFRRETAMKPGRNRLFFCGICAPFLIDCNIASSQYRYELQK